MISTVLSFLYLYLATCLLYRAILGKQNEVNITPQLLKNKNEKRSQEAKSYCVNNLMTGELNLKIKEYLIKVGGET